MLLAPLTRPPPTRPPLTSPPLTSPPLTRPPLTRPPLTSYRPLVLCSLALCSLARSLRASLRGQLIENIFNALCAALELAENQALFLRAEGIELMVLTLKEGKYASRCALRALDAALASNGANCERFVDIRGFKTLFPRTRQRNPTQGA